MKVRFKRSLAALAFGSSAVALSCTGSLDVKTKADASSASSTSSAGTTGAGSGSGASSNGGSAGSLSTTPDEPVPVFPFEAVPARIYVAKVKNLMLGLPATDDEIAAVEADPGALKDMVDAWFVKPEAQAKLGTFFSKAFQQTQITQNEFFDQLGVDNIGNLAVFAQAQESMSRTALKVIADGKPFTETVTTHTFMMTPALMSLYLALDQMQIDDANKSSVSLPMADGSLSTTQSFWITYRADAPIPLSETIDESSPNFMHFAVPNAFSCDVPQLDDTG